MIVDLKLSILRALLGNVPSNLRAVCVEDKEKEVFLYFYFDGEIDDDSRKLAENAIAKVVADYRTINPKIEVRPQIIRVDYPKKMPFHGFWVFYRVEDSKHYVD